MHLLLAQKGTIADGDGEAVDLGQTPGEICVLSAADTELASLAAIDRDEGSSLRLVNLLQLKHPMSVDAWIERTGRHARLIVIRILGGAGYWPYGIEAIHAAAVAHGVRLAVLPGDDKPDPGLARFCTVEPGDCDALWRFLIEGGAENARGFLEGCEDVLAGRVIDREAAPLLKAGLFGAPVPGERGTVAIVFYRALLQAGQTAPVEALAQALAARGLGVLPVYVSSLKDPVSAATVEALFDTHRPDVVLNATGFAVSAPGADRKPTVLERDGAPVIQVVLSSSPKETWDASPQGLNARDLAMNVALPEVDGRVLSRAVSFKSAHVWDAATECNIVAHEPLADRADFVADLAARWVRLRRKDAADKRVAIVLANYPNRDGRLANGVGLDTPAGTVEALRAMAAAGFAVGDVPADGDALIDHLKKGPTNAAADGREIRETISLSEYKAFFATLPDLIQQQVTERWGAPEADPFYRDGVFALPLTRFGRVFVGIQPARGYNIDPKETYHSPDLVPPHGYVAFYACLRAVHDIDAVVHMGKHGNLEWLPGKALALSASCWPEAVLGPLPHAYPFIVNDPGEGTQAKRRTSAVIIDHLTPPLTRAESYGPLKDLEGMVDEYYEAAGGDPRRLKLLKTRILELVRDIGLDQDAGIARGDEADAALEKLDAYLCELKEMQIRDGLHVFGRAPEGRLLADLVTALARVPRGLGDGADASLQRAIADDLGLGFDPLDCAMGEAWAGPRPDMLQAVTDDPWRTAGDTVERIELLAAGLVGGEIECPRDWARTLSVLAGVDARLRPSVEACGSAEIAGLMTALGGRFVEPGPSGAPTRGRPDVLPTGRNFYSVDSRAVPTETAWELGRKSAELLVTRYAQDHGEWPVSFGLTAWGTSNMRTGGDDIAQALALIGAKPVWDGISRRVTGFEIIPVAKLARPRVDVTLRISGFFRDAFPDQIALFDKAVRAVGALEEDEADNPVAARIRAETARLTAEGEDAQSAARRAGYRVFGSKPGAYGAGLQALIDEKGWAERADLAEAYLVWGGYAYGAQAEGSAERGLFEERLKGVQAVVQNQDNREHDLLDSDDYYQFEGGMTAAVETLKGARPTVYHNDHSRPERPVVRTLEDEIGRVVRARVVNPKWIAGVMRHGYKGAFEMAATLDYMFAFAATTGAVRDHHFEAVYQAYLMDETVQDFIAEKNPDALREMAERLLEAIERGLWTPKSNSAMFTLNEIGGRTHGQH
ncbi:cobaltochelatase subunit CobN [Oricola sp.]|uniref:cobaltochelatase subunit CobN n=1 Tax=Oricola sp. TaxID=1979950 RepID=UPI0025CEFDA5|nr:cobaltochelatase subunit CobN [Oricola sp.]MCI5076245.1 cobaltochelatase subunit CobN [Oricola sp.]